MPGFSARYDGTVSRSVLRPALEGDRLFWQDREMVAVRGGTFVVPSAGIEVRFVRDAAGTVVAADYGTAGTRKTRITRTREDRQERRGG